MIKNNKNSTKAILLLILTQMSKAVYTRIGNGATVNFEDVELNLLSLLDSGAQERQVKLLQYFSVNHKNSTYLGD
ncbi:MAG: hypothetical protein E6230_12395 [Paenibacillus dendritiformis]|uniref:hypothetical protein n=1 Tax=Paenibacillus dendritiformis TaxID=130049 RepID=UPI001AFD5625|nr:hypothetical protein [Paenibacillus dendritiformis]MDU5142976.1 hypothetical protein [Paenibacillus dendritiformis]GIO75896.1 hypothetical protein J27TS7_54100 [Paenibacillus dendritiformis]